ncbi:MAG TPA: DUF1080 domain-containing protein, partial [Pirellulales bacterium]|nr:DUF1080 domain-containing protein [Pirellulales bacterium]
MKTCVKLGVIVLACLAVGDVCLAEEKADADGWITLFDGKTLSGWKVSENPEQWKVDDGRIVAAGPRSHLFYMGDDESKPAEFKDFHFKADVMTTPFSNSGIYFHTRYQAVGFPQIGFEAQVNNSHGDPVKTASIYHIVK